MALAGGALVPWMPALEAVNLDHPQRMIVPLDFHGGFSLQYDHSMYASPVRECYVVKGHHIVLLAVETSDPAVAAYYGLDAPGPHYQVKALFREMILRVRMSKGAQSIFAGGSNIEIIQLGFPGDRILLKPSKCSLLGSLSKQFLGQGLSRDSGG